jgi:TetR/AcrR family transcriptional regulator, transcriptional repressor for nem operon
MKISKAESARHREALLQAAMRLFGERGFEKVTVAEIAAGAGLTHGAFYTHFASKEALCAESLETAMREQRERLARAAPDRAAYVTAYLSERHVLNRAGGCPIAALSCDVGRESPMVRAAFTRSLAASTQAASARASAAGQPQEGEAARAAYLARLSTMVGAVALARGVTDTRLRDEILAAAKAALLGGSPAQAGT